MSDENYMRLAIKQAQQAEQNGFVPLGAVIVQDNTVIAAGTSHVGELLDPTAHGETWCMKTACQKLQSLDLSSCTLYTTLEPCSMCLSCAGWTGLSRIVFGAYQEDIDCLYEMKGYHAEDHAQRFAQLQITGGVLREECTLLMRNVKNWAVIRK